MLEALDCNEDNQPNECFGVVFGVVGLPRVLQRECRAEWPSSLEVCSSICATYAHEGLTHRKSAAFPPAHNCGPPLRNVPVVEEALVSFDVYQHVPVTDVAMKNPSIRPRELVR